MGYVVNGICVDSSTEAHSVYFGTMPHFFSSDALNTYDTSYVLSSSLGRSSGSGWTRVTDTRPNGGGAITATVYEDMAAVSFPSCSLVDKFQDGLQVGGSLSAALIMVACIVLLRRGL